MTLAELANIGEFVAAIGVIASLVYLGIQVHNGNALAKANAYREIHQDVGRILNDVANNPELYRVWRKGYLNGEPVSDEDRDKLGMLFFQMFWALDAGLHSAWLDPGIKAHVESLLDFHLKSPVIQGWWSRQRLLHTEPFRSIVDGRLKAFLQRQAADAGEV